MNARALFIGFIGFLALASGITFKVESGAWHFGQQLSAAEVAVTASAEARVFFEPTQSDYDCCNSSILAQQDRYITAKDKGDYDEAVLNALFYWTRAWLHFNKAVSVGVVKGQWVLDADKLNEALGLLDKAETDAKAAKGAGTSKDCLAKVRANRASIKGHLKYFENK